MPDGWAHMGELGLKEMHMSDTLQAMLDSGALYLALGALICIVLGAGAARCLFQGASRIHGSRRRKD